jgi:hypothetical protein
LTDFLSFQSQSYLRAILDEPAFGISSSIRPEPSLSEARAELAEAISRVATSLFKDKYGPLLSTVSQPVVNDFLRRFEVSVSRTKGDLTLVFEELLDRVVPKGLGEMDE